MRGAKGDKAKGDILIVLNAWKLTSTEVYSLISLFFAC